MINEASMFLHNVTVIDGAYVDSNGVCVGFSFSPRFHVSGKVSEDESVVVDFSTIKKDLKAFIDDKETGIDHKLLVFTEGHGDNKVTLGCVSHVTLHPEKDKGKKKAKSSANTKTKPFVRVVTATGTEIDTDVYAVKELDIRGHRRPELDAKPIVLIQYWLQQEINNHFPDLDIKVSLESKFNHVNPIDVHGWVLTQAQPITYVHGLKDSTSFGCQNIMHGHRSFIQLVGIREEYADNKYKASLDKVCKTMARFMDGKYLVAERNYAPSGGSIPEDRDWVGYESRDRGKFSVLLGQPHLVLPHETTIECIVHYMYQQFRSQLRELGVSQIYISEGLEKGAFYSV
ncbi:6-pyruvoyl tetrahydropterin synthase-like protein [Vibrio phage vB_VcorM_GR11A]|nr:6-pyruvoyl tetrahydropterin synthase-like protein [Vibrio phage vB_VcorM_GR11A]